MWNGRPGYSLEYSAMKSGHNLNLLPLQNEKLELYNIIISETLACIEAYTEIRLNDVFNTVSVTAYRGWQPIY